jgi:hypothetical protein
VPGFSCYGGTAIWQSKSAERFVRYGAGITVKLFSFWEQNRVRAVLQVKKQETRAGPLTMTVLEIPSRTLNDGHAMPGIGMGYCSSFHRECDSPPTYSCWMGSPGGAEEATRTTELALKLGYRHIDTVRSQ